MNRAHLVLLVVLLLPATATPAAATPVDGTVTVANGTADGEMVTITPMDGNYQRADDPVNTTVSGGSFSADAPDAPLYFVRLRHDDAAHYALSRNGSQVTFDLSETVSGRVVGPNGTARENVSVALQSELGPVVNATTTDADGHFAFGPVRADANYTVEVRYRGAPYRRAVRTGTNATNVTVRTRSPTDDSGVLTATTTANQPAGHLLRVVAPPNASARPTVVETLTLRNTGDRPFVGPVSISLPENVSVFAGMYRGQRVPVTPDGNTVTVDASVAAGDTARVGVAYALDGRTLTKPVAYSPDRVAVVMQGYEADAVDHSSNLRVGDAPIAMLTNAGQLENGETIRVTLPSDASSASSGSTATAAAGGDSNTMPRFPAVELGSLLAAVVVGGIFAYRFTR